MRDREYRAVAREPHKAERLLTARLAVYRARLAACEAALSAEGERVIEGTPYPRLWAEANQRLTWAGVVAAQMRAALDRHDVGLAASASHHLLDLILACEFYLGLIRAIHPATGSGSPPLPQEKISC